MAQFIINKKYLPKDQSSIAQLFIVLTRSSKQEDITDADEVLKVLSARFPSAVLMNISLEGVEPLPEKGTEAEQTAWLEGIQPAWLNFIRQQQQEFLVSATATALVGVGALGALVLELSKLEQPLAGRLIGFGARFLTLPDEPISLDQTLHLFHAAKDVEVDAKHSHIAQMAIENLEGDCTIDLVQGLVDSLDPALITQMRVRLETCIPLRILKEVQASGGQ